MRFDSKAHMVQELLAGKRFKDRTRNNGILYYDERLINPFQYGKEPAFGIWQMYDKDIWEEVESTSPPVINGSFDLCQRTVVEEVKPRHVHQDLIDSYQDGQVWQYRHNTNANWLDLSNHLTSWQPDWDEDTQYRLHPHNDLIQAHSRGAKIQVYSNDEWVDIELEPYWHEGSQYRIKPATKTIYEWTVETRFSRRLMIIPLLMNEEEASEYFHGRKYHKTGRSWEVEV
jgi:hypothetical protein